MRSRHRTGRPRFSSRTEEAAFSAISRTFGIHSSGFVFRSRFLYQNFGAHSGNIPDSSIPNCAAIWADIGRRKHWETKNRYPYPAHGFAISY